MKRKKRKEEDFLADSSEIKIPSFLQKADNLILSAFCILFEFFLNSIYISFSILFF